MRRLSRICTERPRTCLTLVSILTLALAATLPRIELRTDGAALYPLGDPAVDRTARDRVLFQDPEELILLLTSRPGGPDLASTTGLRFLAQVHDEVAALPGIRASGVRSAASLVDVATSGLGALGRFLDDLPEAISAETPAETPELEALLRRLRGHPWTEGLFLSADGTAAALYVPLETPREGAPEGAPEGTPEGTTEGTPESAPGRLPTLERLENWVETRADGPFELRLTGPTVAEALLGDRILEDLGRLVPILVLVVAALLLVCLRTPGGVLVAMTKTLVVLVWTGGLMALCGIPLTLVTTILPVLLLALCVTDEVHVLARLQARLRTGRDRVSDALLETLAELRRPVVYTSLSTALGFLSFVSASIVPLRHFGVFAAVGLVLAMLTTFTLTPALVALLSASWWVPRASRRPLVATPGSPRRSPRRSPSRRSRLSRYRTAGLVAGLLLLAAGIPGLLRLTVQDSWVESFDPEGPLVQAEREFNARFWGSYRFDVVLTGPPGLFHRPEGMALVASVARAGAAAPHAGGVMTPLVPLGTVAEVLGLAHGVPELPAEVLRAVVQVGETYGEQTGLRRLVTPDGGAARVLVLVNSPNYQRAAALADHVERELQVGELADRIEDAGADVHVSGDIPLALATVRAIVRNQLRSIAWTLAGVGLLLLLVNRKPWLTLVQLVPAAAAAWLILSAMGYLGMPLGVATSMFAALTIGVGVDLALHVTYAYQDVREGLERGPSNGPERAEHAIALAFDRTAAGRRWSTGVLALGFLVLTASAFGPNHDLGLLLAAAMATSYLTTGLFVPGMLAR